MPKHVFRLFAFTMCYFQLDSMMKPYVYDTVDLFRNDPPVQFQPIIQTMNIFVFGLFTVLTIHLLFLSKIENYTVYSMACIYIKYLIDMITYFNEIGSYQHSMRRSLMWLFTTPLILQMYCNINNTTLTTIHAHYHTISNALHIVLYPFRHIPWCNYCVLGLFAFEFLFICKMYQYRDKKYTKLLIYIWTLFSCLVYLDMSQRISIEQVHVCYSMSDMIAKVSIILIVNDHEEYTYYVRSAIDLQSISLLSTIKKTIRQFTINGNTTSKCKQMIDYLDLNLSSLVPVDKTTLKLELLHKILPLNLDISYLNQSNEYKTCNFVCILFTDIVSYTELAKIYEADVIYKMLNDIYTRFDDIVIKYKNLQKIETIGDAYMVVGDIYTNDTKDNVKNIILLALDFMKEIKTITTPNDKPLQIRVGINLGKVVVGILGVEIPRLCVIGNAVNVASRLQTTTDPDTIQISRHIYEIAKTTDFGIDVRFELRENVLMKNLGSVNTYLLRPPPDELNE